MAFSFAHLFKHCAPLDFGQKPRQKCHLFNRVGRWHGGLGWPQGQRLGPSICGQLAVAKMTESQPPVFILSQLMEPILGHLIEGFLDNNLQLALALTIFSDLNCQDRVCHASWTQSSRCDVILDSEVGGLCYILASQQHFSRHRPYHAEHTSSRPITEVKQH